MNIFVDRIAKEIKEDKEEIEKEIELENQMNTEELAKKKFVKNTSIDVNEKIINAIEINDKDLSTLK